MGTLWAHTPSQVNIPAVRKEEHTVLTSDT